MSHIAVLGAGSWGTALSAHLADKGLDVRLWSAVPEELEAIAKERRNSKYLPGLALPRSISVEADLEVCLDESIAVAMALPGRYYHQTLSREPLLTKAKAGSLIVNFGKGLCHSADSADPCFASEAYAKSVGDTESYIIASGPTFARELAEKHFTAILVSGKIDDRTATVCDLLRAPHLRPDAGSDPLGAEICGAMKNGYAVLAGACAGLGYAANTYSAMLTDCLAEMIAFAVSQGADPETFTGLVGVGDLVLTAGSKLSRNYRLGSLVAQGKAVPQAQAEIGQETEGYYTAMAADWFSARYGGRLPILSGIKQMLQGEIAPEDLVASLFA